jgi:hypothetical protein
VPLLGGAFLRPACARGRVAFAKADIVVEKDNVGEAQPLFCALLRQNLATLENKAVLALLRRTAEKHLATIGAVRRTLWMGSKCRK